MLFSSVPPSNSFVLSLTLDLPCLLLSELQRNKDTVRYATPRAEVPGHRQEHLRRKLWLSVWWKRTSIWCLPILGGPGPLYDLPLDFVTKTIVIFLTVSCFIVTFFVFKRNNKKQAELKYLCGGYQALFKGSRWHNMAPSYLPLTWLKDSFITLDRELLKRVNFFICRVHSSSLNNFKMDWDKLTFFHWKVRVFVAIWSWFHGKIFIGLGMTAFWKKVCQKEVFSACEKGALFSVLVYFRNMSNFARLWCPNHLTHRDSWGIIGKIISIAFIWYLVVLYVTTLCGNNLAVKWHF